MRILRTAVVGVALLAGAAGSLNGGQMPQSPQQPGQNPGFPSLGGAKGGDIDPISPRMSEAQARARSTERQKRLMADTDKLLELATDLKQQVDKTNKDILSVDVIKKADEIEKLAHSVKERMKGT
jgi:hypothetical protein